VTASGGFTICAHAIATANGGAEQVLTKCTVAEGETVEAKLIVGDCP